MSSLLFAHTRISSAHARRAPSFCGGALLNVPVYAHSLYYYSAFAFFDSSPPAIAFESFCTIARAVELQAHAAREHDREHRLLMRRVEQVRPSEDRPPKLPQEEQSRQRVEPDAEDEERDGKEREDELRDRGG